jgi:hypothetical protein
MGVIDISKFEDTVVIHFDTEDKRINAYTLASTLVAIADAAKAANTSLNSGCEIEIVVEAFGQGSFRALIRAIYSKSRNLLANQVIMGIAIGVIGNYIYERTLAVDNKITIEVKTDEVIIQKGQDRVIVPRHIYDATREAEKNPQFVKAMHRTFEAVASDEKVRGFGLVQSMESPAPEIIIPRGVFQGMSLDIPEDPNARIVSEDVDVQILKAILERSRRKWEFVWRGIKISAPVTDEHFYVNFFSHDITIAPGDVLRVKLAIRQTRDSTTGIYSNVGYEVTQVYEHVPRIRQVGLLSQDENKIDSEGP